MSSSVENLKWKYCPVCKRKLFRSAGVYRIEIKCVGCGTITMFEARPKSFLGLDPGKILDSE